MFLQKIVPWFKYDCVSQTMTILRMKVGTKIDYVGILGINVNLR